MPNSKVCLQNLRLQNFKKFRDTNVELEPRLTVFSGKNGSGKSSVLAGAKIFLSWIIARLRNDSGVGSYISPLDVNNNAQNGCVTCEIFDEKVHIPNKAKPGQIKEYTFDLSAIKEYISEKRRSLTEFPQTTCLPVFAFYGVRRAVIDIPLKTRNQEFSLFDAYEKCLDGAANFRSFFTWFRAGEDWENQEMARKKTLIEHRGLGAFRRAMTIFMPGYENIYIERHPLAMMIRKEGERLNVEQLSDGEKIYLALIGDLCHRLSLANPVGDPLLGEGIVLIDELDLHLHPQWQSEIASALIRTFPNIQFITTTHSPHVLNSVATKSLRLIADDGSITEADYGYGMPSEIVLGDLMRLSSDVPESVMSAIRNFTVALGKECSSSPCFTE